LDIKLQDKKLWTKRQAFPTSALLLISSCIEFWFVNVFPK
jgi:hypothetical protein